MYTKLDKHTLQYSKSSIEASDLLDYLSIAKLGDGAW